ncbi:MAG: LptF/LptG family permease [Phycisphaeraceae bacterium]|nr:LptF/LptG family permease [Phycisphaeraceae bacterium]
MDRYIARQFMVNFLILFVACIGLIILVEMMGNAGKVIESVGDRGGRWYEVAWAMVDFYGPKAILYYNYLVGIMPIGAAGFTLVRMVRQREIAALLSSGVSLHRIVAPIFVLGFVFSSVGMAINQEWVMPKIAHLLGRRTEDLRTGKVRDFELLFVPDSRGRLFTAGRFDPQGQTMDGLTILIREVAEDPDPADPTDDRYGRAVARIEARSARWSQRRHGWELVEGRRIRLKPATGGRSPPEQSKRIEPVDFLQTDLTPRVALMHYRARFRNFLSMGQLNDLIANPPKVVDVADLQRIRHARFSQLIINLLVMAIGIPFFMVRFPRNMFVPAIKALGLALGTWAFAIVMIQVGPGGLPPAMAAWLPVIVCLPLAYYMLDSVET